MFGPDYTIAGEPLPGPHLSFLIYQEATYYSIVHNRQGMESHKAIKEWTDKSVYKVINMAGTTEPLEGMDCVICDNMEIIMLNKANQAQKK